jgi:hypothetical protein
MLQNKQMQKINRRKPRTITKTKEHFEIATTSRGRYMVDGLLIKLWNGQVYIKKMCYTNLKKTYLKKGTNWCVEEDKETAFAEVEKAQNKKLCMK